MENLTSQLPEDLTESNVRGRLLLVISNILRDQDKKERPSTFVIRDPLDELITFSHLKTLNIIIETAGLSVSESPKDGLEIERLRNFPSYVYSKLSEAVIKNIGDIIYI